MATWDGTEAPPQAKKLRAAVKEMMTAFILEIGEKSHPPEVDVALQQTVATADFLSDVADYEYPLTLFPLDQPSFTAVTAEQRKSFQKWNDFALLWNAARKRASEEGKA